MILDCQPCPENNALNKLSQSHHILIIWYHLRIAISNHCHFKFYISIIQYKLSYHQIIKSYQISNIISIISIKSNHIISNNYEFINYINHIISKSYQAHLPLFWRGFYRIQLFIPSHFITPKLGKNRGKDTMWSTCLVLALPALRTKKAWSRSLHNGALPPFDQHSDVGVLECSCGSSGGKEIPNWYLRSTSPEIQPLLIQMLIHPQSYPLPTCDCSAERIQVPEEQDQWTSVVANLYPGCPSQIAGSAPTMPWAPASGASNCRGCARIRPCRTTETARCTPLQLEGQRTPIDLDDFGICNGQCNACWQSPSCSSEEGSQAIFRWHMRHRIRKFECDAKIRETKHRANFEQTCKVDDTSKCSIYDGLHQQAGLSVAWPPEKLRMFHWPTPEEFVASQQALTMLMQCLIGHRLGWRMSKQLSHPTSGGVWEIMVASHVLVQSSFQSISTAVPKRLSPPWRS